MATGKKAKDNDHHGGQDYAGGLGKVSNQYYMYAQTDSTITQESFIYCFLYTTCISMASGRDFIQYITCFDCLPFMDVFFYHHARY